MKPLHVWQIAFFISFWYFHGFFVAVGVCALLSLVEVILTCIEN